MNIELVEHLGYDMWACEATLTEGERTWRAAASSERAAVRQVLRRRRRQLRHERKLHSA